MATKQFFTIDDAVNLVDTDNWELIEGELFELSPASGRSSEVAANLLIEIGKFVRERGLGVVTGADGGYMLERNPDTLVAPDIAFVNRQKLPDGAPSSFIAVVPDLVVEIQSPSDRSRHIEAKRAIYQRVRVPLVWWVDPEARTVLVQRPGHEDVVVPADGALDGDPVLPGLRIVLTDVFD